MLRLSRALLIASLCLLGAGSATASASPHLETVRIELREARSPTEAHAHEGGHTGLEAVDGAPRPGASRSAVRPVGAQPPAPSRRVALYVRHRALLI